MRRTAGALTAAAAMLVAPLAVTPTAAGGATSSTLTPEGSLGASLGSTNGHAGVAAGVTVSAEAGTAAAYVDWSDTAPLAGQRTVLTVVFGPATSGQTVTLEGRATAQDPWVRVAARQAGVSGSRGTATFSVLHDRAGVRQYRVRALAHLDSPTATSAPVTVAVTRQRVGLASTWRPGIAQRGQSGVHVSGTLAQARTSRPVVLQVRRDGRWVAVARTSTRAGGYRVPVPTSSYGRFTYRLQAPVTARQRRAGILPRVSALKTFRVRRPWAPGLIPQAQSEVAPPENPLGSAADYRLFYADSRWNPCTSISYRVNPTYGPPTALSDVHGAVARVEAASGLDFVYRGTTTVIPKAHDAAGYPADTQIVVAWASRAQSPMISGDQVAGVGGPIGWSGTYDEAGRPVTTYRLGTVVLNSAFNWLQGGFGTGATTGKLAMHELGHVVGLAHAGGTTQVMYPVLQQAYPSAWGAGDLTGLRVQGAEPGCLYNRDGSTPTYQRTASVSVVSSLIADTAPDAAG